MDVDFDKVSISEKMTGKQHHGSVPGLLEMIKSKLSSLQHKYDSFVQESKWYAPMIDTLKSFGILLPGTRRSTQY